MYVYGSLYLVVEKEGGTPRLGVPSQLFRLCPEISVCLCPALNCRLEPATGCGRTTTARLLAEGTHRPQHTSVSHPSRRRGTTWYEAAVLPSWRPAVKSSSDIQHR